MNARVKLSAGFDAQPCLHAGSGCYDRHVTDTHGTNETGPLATPQDRKVTVNQVVARAMAFYRRAAGLTQAQLGDLIPGWSERMVSDAERSWKSGRVREFDAQLMTDIAGALGIPITALLQPPPDDGDSTRYMVSAAGREMGMGEFFDKLVMYDTDGDGPAMTAYREALRDVVYRYLQPDWAKIVVQSLGGSLSPGQRADLVAMLRDQADAATAHARAWAHLADEMEGQ